MTRIDVARLRELLERRSPRVAEAENLAWAAVALMLRDTDRGTEALFIRRAHRRGDLWSGQIAFPGGRWSPEDASLAATAIRESREEVAISLDPETELVGQLDDAVPGTPVQPPVAVRPFVFHLARPIAVRHSAEVADSFWIPLSVLRAPEVRMPTDIAIRGRTRRFPAYVVGDSVIWGLTERILTDLLVLVA